MTGQTAIERQILLDCSIGLRSLSYLHGHVGRARWRYLPRHAAGAPAVSAACQWRRGGGPARQRVVAFHARGCSSWCASVKCTVIDTVTDKCKRERLIQYIKNQEVAPCDAFTSKEDTHCTYIISIRVLSLLQQEIVEHLEFLWQPKINDCAFLITLCSHMYV